MSARVAPFALVLLLHGVAGTVARADVVTEWNIKAGELVTAARLPTPPANRVMAITHTAAYEAANAITRRYPASRPGVHLDAPAGASAEAAIAAAHRTALARLLPAQQQAAVDEAYRVALAGIADGPAKNDGIAVGQQAAMLVLAARGDDGAASAEVYRPATTAGAYVPTSLPAAAQWPQHRP